MNHATSMPQPEDFGLSADAVQNIPQPVIAPRRGVLCVALITSITVAAVAAIIWLTGSSAAGLFLGPLLVAVSLILLLPVVMGCVCLADHLEACWRASRDPRFRACMQYRRALDDFAGGQDRGSAAESHVRWRFLGRDRLRDLAAELLARGGEAEPLDRQATGADILVRRNGRTIAVRCEAGPKAAHVGAGRELAMARIDLGSDEAVMVAPGGADDLLQRYVQSHPIRVLDVAALVALRELPERD